MPIAGPFYFAWVEPDETVFTSDHHRMDEYIFSARRVIAEGEKPLLEIEIQNPHIGILSPTRKYWAWFSWFNGSEIVPVFFGRVVGVPAQIFEEVIVLQLVADPTDYKQRVQRVAETLKYRPYYDQVFIDVMQRDDPNTILEAHTKVWDVNPVTHAVTANDIIIGSDGNEDFTGDDHFYDSMQMTIGQPPATAILMDASVNWTQTSRGIVDIIPGYRVYSTDGGDGIISDWPKPLGQLGGGWSVFYGDAYDTAGAADAKVANISWSWTNKEKEHSDGDCLSVTGSMSAPMGGTVSLGRQLTFERVIGVQDPYAVDEYGDPSPVNIPASVHVTSGYVMGWHVLASLVLQYDAARARTERVIFLVRADTQPVLTHPELSQESEVMTKSGADVGVPIINLLNWTTIAGTFVDVGQIIFPDNPSIPGGRSAQICVTAGIAGLFEPDFSDVPGFTTTDGTVLWSSMGSSTPADNAVDWTPISHANLGAIILPKRPNYVSYYNLVSPGIHSFPQKSVNVAEGTYIQMPDGSFKVVTINGVLGPAGNSATLASVTLPSGHSYFMCTKAGTTGAKWIIPPFNETLHAVTNDNDVEWTCIGSGEIPAGGYPGEVHAATYFATDRGRQSLEYLGACVRAKLLYRARCIEIMFDCEYSRGVALTTRKTVTLHDPRIAGGLALGKIKNTELSVSDTGVAGCRVTLACCAGLGNSVTESPGTQGYVEDGYVAEGYQQHDDVTIVLPDATDLSYAPPIYTLNDDGITFPITLDQVKLVDIIHLGGAGAAGAALGAMEAAAKAAATPSDNTLLGDFNKQQHLEQLQSESLGHYLQLDPFFQEFQIKPVNSGPFHRVYNVRFSNLQVPMGINLESETVT